MISFLLSVLLLSGMLASCKTLYEPIPGDTEQNRSTESELTESAPADSESTQKPDPPESPIEDGIQIGADSDASWGPLNTGIRSAEPVVYDLKECAEKIKVYGRSLSVPIGIACDHIASGIEFRVEAAGKIKLKANSSATLYYAVYVNGEQRERLKLQPGTAEYELTGALPKGVYQIKLINQTGVAYGRSELISISMNGRLLEAPGASEHLIEFIGDSITSGYGLVSGATTAPEHFDATKSYAYQTAGLLNADHSVVAVTGWAILPESPDNPVKGCVPAIYGKVCPWGRADTAYQPEKSADVVVINLGTNDVLARSNYETDFVSAAKAFALQVRAVHPDAAIIWCYGQMLTGESLTALEEKIQTVITDLGGSASGYYSVKLVYNQSAFHGHPDAASQTESARILADFIKKNGLM